MSKHKYQINKNEYNNMDDIHSFIKLCNYNENLVDKYTKIYDDIFDDWDFDSAANYNNQSNLNIENFTDKTDNITSKCLGDLNTIYTDLKLLNTNIKSRADEKKLTKEHFESDHKIKEMIQNTTQKIDNRCQKLDKHLHTMFELFYDDYAIVKDIIGLDDYKHIVKKNDDIEFENYLSSNGIDTAQYEKFSDGIDDIKTIENFELMKSVYNNNTNSTKTTEQFLGGVTRAIRGIGNAIKGIPNGIKKILGFFKKIIQTIAKLGKSFGKMIVKLGKSIGKILKKLFGVVIKVFKFVAKNLIPLMKVLIKFVWRVIKFIPRAIRLIIRYYVWLFKFYITLIKNYIKCPIAPWIFLIILFFGLQIYIKYITELPSSIPPQWILAFAAFITIHQLYYNVNLMKSINKLIMKAIIWLINRVDKKLNFKGKRLDKQLALIIPFIAKNLSKIIFFILMSFVIIKVIINYIIKKIKTLIPL
jgi:hypothetical protein